GLSRRPRDQDLLAGLQVAEVVRGDPPMLGAGGGVVIEYALDAERRRRTAAIVTQTRGGNRVEPQLVRPPVLFDARGQDPEALPPEVVVVEPREVEHDMAYVWGTRRRKPVVGQHAGHTGRRNAIQVERDHVRTRAQSCT